MIASSEDTSSFACSPTGPRLKSTKKSRRRVVLSSSSHGLLDRQFAKIILSQLERTALSFGYLLGLQEELSSCAISFFCFIKVFLLNVENFKPESPSRRCSSQI
ncbi:uncharacterized protein M6B38_345005 [Iris pallida]|uniref:Uncharacterized protein n=1 Tax=Iris pallida TaxID=29817 RepID=A0AAX6F095_IRIPA|nr:uncharacterized protein M6B38_162730 [Iris pallida]KAJ6831990.1 uncharacterized protein M6B38_345005 [Iris pallida]